MTTHDCVQLPEARDALDDRLRPVERTETIPVREAVGRVLAETVSANRSVPHYPRAAMDGYAVLADDTDGASEREPVTLELTEGELDRGQTVAVHTGSELPSRADAVVRVERTVEREGGIEVLAPVESGKDVAPVGEDVDDGEVLYGHGHQLRPSDVGLLKSVGERTVCVYERPTVAVVPTGEELVQESPDRGEVVETNGLTVSTYVREWGGNPTYADVVTDDPDDLRAAIEGALNHDVVVTTGGSSVGDRDLLPEIVAELGDVLVDGVAIKPGHPVTLGIVDETPVVMLPGYPVSCIISAVQFVHPVLKSIGRMSTSGFPTVKAELSEPIRSEPGIRRFVRVTIRRSGDRPVVTETWPSSAGALSSVGFTDGWVVVPEDVERIPEGETVTVHNWEPNL
jgi:molybdopterin molybdotransferase